jgi:hypothetical protein
MAKNQSRSRPSLPYLPSELQELIFKARNNRSNYNAYNVQLYTLPALTGKEPQKAVTIRAVNNASRAITMNKLRSKGFPFAHKEQAVAKAFPRDRVPEYFSGRGYIIAPFPTNQDAIESIFTSKLFPNGSRRVKHSNTKFTVYLPKQT